MSFYYQLLRDKDQFVEEFAAALRDSRENERLERGCATSLQRVFRGVSTRNNISRRGYYVNEIQRVFRGFMGREKANSHLAVQLDGRQLSLFHYYSIQIQKCVRGFYSRKYKHDHERRKRFRKRIADDGERVRQQMEDYSIKQKMYEEDKAQAEKEEAFRDLASNLHHLVSTKQIPGVYNPSQQFLEIPTMNNLPVENHVRAVVKDLLRTRGIAKTGMETDIHGTKKIPWKGLKYKLSLQASAPYDTLKEAERSEKLSHKITTKGKGIWKAGGKTGIINKNTEPLSCGYPYIDPWANPMLVKGVPDNTKQLQESARVQKPMWVRRNPEKPFVTRVGGNKSSTAANDVFDTIQEANETGGAAQRHLGTGTERFGLSRSMDSRGYGSALPMAPIRASSQLKSTNQSLRVYTHAATADGVLPSVATGLSAQSSIDSVEMNKGIENTEFGEGIDDDSGFSNKFQTLMNDADILSSDED